jgi:tetratricopeptide (TPR) repeat protein
MMDNLELDEARKLCDMALKIDRNHGGALETRALLALEEDKPKDAKKLLLRAIECSPDEGFSKYMYMGQIEGGENALQYYGKAMQIMLAQAQTLQESEQYEELAELSEEIAEAFCTTADLYLTDLWYNLK